MNLDFSDWFVMAGITAILISGTMFIYLHPSEVNFATWAGLMVTVTGVYHWLDIRDDKEKDAI